MKKLTLLFIIFFFNSFLAFSAPNKISYLNKAAIVAKVESFTESGFLNCEILCFLDMKYNDIKVKPNLFFQVGTAENPTAYLNKNLCEDYINKLVVEKVYHDNNYKIMINFGEVKLVEGFKARLVIVENGQTNVFQLKPSSFDDEITKMGSEPESTLCKAEEFLKRIDFENLYKGIKSF